MHIGPDGWLVEDASGLPELKRVPSVRTTQLDVATGGKPKGIVWHWTAGPCSGPKFAPALVDEIRTYDKNKDRAASWHVLVAKDGRIFQSVPFDRGSWHVGKPGRFDGRLYANVNRAAVGVELENSGRLEKVGDKFYRWPFWLDPDHKDNGPDPRYELPPARAVLHGGQFFDEFPAAQVQAATRLLQALVVTFKWPRSECVHGHRDFDPARKEDPGPLWQEVVLPQILVSTFGA